jgi:hypothetical protein
MSSQIKIHQKSATNLLFNTLKQESAAFLLSPVRAKWLLAKNSSSRAEAQRILVYLQQY